MAELLTEIYNLKEMLFNLLQQQDTNNNSSDIKAIKEALMQIADKINELEEKIEELKEKNNPFC